MLISTCSCAECGGVITNTYAGLHPRRFCSEPCQRLFKNRQAQRGRLFYELVMTMRYDRSHFGEARSILWNLARASRDADKALREGRPSWRPIDIVRSSVPLAYGNEGDRR